MLLAFSAGLSKWICCWLCYTRSARRISKQFYKPEFSSRVLSIWYREWLHVSGLLLSASYEKIKIKTYSLCCLYHRLGKYELRTAYFRTTWLMVHKVYLPRWATMTHHRMMDRRTTMEWGMLMRFSLRFLLIQTVWYIIIMDRYLAIVEQTRVNGQLFIAFSLFFFSSHTLAWCFADLCSFKVDKVVQHMCRDIWILCTPNLLPTTTHSQWTCRPHNSSRLSRVRAPKIRRFTTMVKKQ